MQTVTVTGPGSIVTWLQYLLGRRTAIEDLASHRGAWLPGIALVLLTSIPRNYDQTWIGEKPFPWIGGNLIFSLVSGTFLFLVVRVGFLRGRIADPVIGPGRRWTQFMGLFWATAPIAWLYAIPVERFLAPVEAAQANVVLLAIVSAWRVLLMARVVAVVHAAPYWGALGWVLTAACLETMAVFVFGGAFSRQVMAGMAGMRNSPAEDVMLSALGASFSGAVVLFLPALFAGQVARGIASRFSAEQPTVPRPLPWAAVVIAAVLWIGVAVPAQIQTRRNAQVDSLMSANRFREVLDHLARHGPNAYAASRQLPPKVYEITVYQHLCGLMGALGTTDPPWLHRHLIDRLEESCAHLEYQPSDGPPHPSVDSDRISWRAQWVVNRTTLHDWMGVIDGLERSDAGRTFLSNNRALFELLTDFLSQLETDQTKKGPVVLREEMDTRLVAYPKPPPAGN